MQINSENESLNRITYLTGNAEIVASIRDISVRCPFDEDVISFLNEVSRLIMSNREAKLYSDVITFAFWIRRSSVLNLKERFQQKGEGIQIGKGVAFHIAPSNVPCNFAYSMVAGLLTGNANIVRIPSKEFPQVDILVDAFNKALEKHEGMRPYVVLCRYGRDKDINDLLSGCADIRIVWGGDNTIAELRKSALPPRAGEITFADRYSLAVIDSNSYLDIENKRKIAEDFYNDTFFSDQNACTSPRIVIWTGTHIEKAKEIFWQTVHTLVKEKYTYQSIQGVNKLTSSYLIAAAEPGTKVEPHTDNLIIRVKIPEVNSGIMDFKDNSGYFLEYDCTDIMEIRDLCNDKRCQTIAYIGNSMTLIPLINSGVSGIDRIVPMGKTMDFDLIWDGYNLPSLLTRTIIIN